MKKDSSWTSVLLVFVLTPRYWSNWNRFGVVGTLVEQNPCSVYLAESTIQNAGWGVFAARDFELGERIVSKRYTQTERCKTK